MTRPIFIAFLTLTAGFSLTAAQPQQAQEHMRGPEHRVTVTGTGEIRVAPDMAVLTAEAGFTRRTVKEAADETRKAMDAILKAARKSVRSPEDLRTSRLSVSPEYDYSNAGGRKLRGYAASQSLEITVRDLAAVEPLTDALFETPMTGLGNLEMRHSKADSLRREAGALAMRDARDNAAKLCAAANRSCEELIGVRMAGAAGPAPMPLMFAERAMKSDAGNGVPLQAGVLNFSASVEADFRLK